MDPLSQHTTVNVTYQLRGSNHYYCIIDDDNGDDNDVCVCVCVRV